MFSKKVSFLALPFIPVMLGRFAVSIRKNPMEIADVFITNSNRNIGHISVGVAKQECRLGKPFFLN